jgi:hypothetical protein
MPKEEQIKEAYAALGRFMQEFAHACHALQMLILFTLQVRGGLKDQQMGMVLLGNRAIGANTLKDMALHLMGHISGGKAEPVFSDIAKRFGDLTEARNDLMHGLTFVGWGNEQTTDWSEFEAYKISSNATGHYVKELPKSATELEPWIFEAREITKLIWRYHGCATGRYKPENNFTLVDGHYRSIVESERVSGARTKVRGQKKSSAPG